MENTASPRGIRNCNPLNLIKSDNAWLGKVVPGSDPTFEQFTSMEFGIRAAMLTLKSYIKKHHVHTVADIIHRWSPDGAHLESSYINFVCNSCQWPPSQVIDIKNRNHVIMLLQAMARFECGQEIPYHYFDKAYALTFNRKG